MKNENSCILIVDDNPSDLGLLERAIKSCKPDASIVSMNNGNESLCYLMGDGVYCDRSKYPYPTMIITDLKMPSMDGFDILEHFKNNPTWMVIPTIILSSSQDSDDIQTAYFLGASAYHVKPLDYHVFEKLIKELVCYWTNVEKPISDYSGQMVYTNSINKCGQRFIKPQRVDQQRIIE